MVTRRIRRTMTSMCLSWMDTLRAVHRLDLVDEVAAARPERSPDPQDLHSSTPAVSLVPAVMCSPSSTSELDLLRHRCSIGSRAVVRGHDDLAGLVGPRCSLGRWPTDRRQTPLGSGLRTARSRGRPCVMSHRHTTTGVGTCASSTACPGSPDRLRGNDADPPLPTSTSLPVATTVRSTAHRHRPLLRRSSTAHGSSRPPPARRVPWMSSVVVSRDGRRDDVAVHPPTSWARVRVATEVSTYPR